MNLILIRLLVWGADTCLYFLVCGLGFLVYGLGCGYTMNLVLVFFSVGRG